MNIRGTDSTALAAVTDLFVAPAPSRDGGAGGFQQALQPPRPYEAFQAETPRPNSKSLERPAPEAPAEEIASCQHEDCRPAETNSEPAETVVAEQAAPVTEEVADKATAETPATEESTDEQNVAAESLAAAAVAVTEQHLPAQQPVTVTTAATGSEQSAEETSESKTSVPTVSDPAVVAEPLLTTPAEQTDDKTEVAVAEPVVAVAAGHAVPETTADASAAEGTEPTAGIGVLPSAVAPQATNNAARNSAPRTTAKTASSGQDRAAAVNTQDESQQEAAPVVSSEALSTEQLTYTEDDSDAGPKKGEQPWFAVDKLPTLATPQADVSAKTELKIDLPAAPTEAPVVSELHSTHNQSPDATKLTTTQPLSTAAGSSRLPAQALVRGTPQEKTPAPLHVDAARFLQRVTKAFESARERGGEIRLRLSPPELGALRVEVNMSEHGLAARVEVETNDARTILLENLPALRERLAEQGLRLEKFDVELSQREPEQRGGDLPDQSRERQSPPEARAVRSPIARPSVVATTQTEIAPTTGWQDRQLNVIV
jgi:flagellar hook-length control protein FliK